MSKKSTSLLEKFNSKSVAERSCIFIVVTLAIFMAVLSLEAVATWGTLEFTTKKAYAMIMGLSSIFEIFGITCLIQNNKEK